MQCSEAFYKLLSVLCSFFKFFSILFIYSLNLVRLFFVVVTNLTSDRDYNSFNRYQFQVVSTQIVSAVVVIFDSF